MLTKFPQPKVVQRLSTITLVSLLPTVDSISSTRGQHHILRVVSTLSKQSESIKRQQCPKTSNHQHCQIQLLQVIQREHTGIKRRSTSMQWDQAMLVNVMR
jgi:hypothetical protein